MQPDLTGGRNQIDRIDDQLLKLFIERMNCAAEVAKYKKANHLNVYDPGRERQILLKIAKGSPKELRGYSRVLYSILFDLSRSYQHFLTAPDSELINSINNSLAETPERFPEIARVGCMGIEGAYAQAAADRMFKTADLKFHASFKEVFDALDSGAIDYGVLPIENTSAGTVDAVYDLLKQYKFHIVRSCRIQINHALLGVKGAGLADVKTVYSHPHGLRQCSEFLARHPEMTAKIAESTAGAARFVAQSKDRSIAAIASGSCGKLYGLQVLAEAGDIQNSDYNYTRFICISKKLEIYSGADRISIMVSLPHKPGALYGMISKFSALGVNLTKLESRPIVGRDFEYMFYFDFDATVTDSDIRQLMSELEFDSESFVFLGNYSEI